MKRFDLIKITNKDLLVKYNLSDDAHGIVIVAREHDADVLFFNPQNVGEHILVNVNKRDLTIESEKLPQSTQTELANKLDTIVKNAKTTFSPMPVQEYDMVELLVEKEKYAKYGIHKGARGYVQSTTAIQNNIEVDFTQIDENGECSGECLGVNIYDLKVVK